MEVALYTSNTCGYCHAAKRLLQERGIAYREIDLTHDRDLRMQLMQQTGHRTVPQVFINDAFIGGFTELSLHLSKH